MRLTTGGPYDALLAGDGAWKQAVRIDVESHDLQNVVGLMVDEALSKVDKEGGGV